MVFGCGREYIGINIEEVNNGIADILNTEEGLNAKYQSYYEDSEKLSGDWQGEVSDVYSRFSECMNEIAKNVMDFTDTFRENTNTFLEESIEINEKAKESAEVVV